MFDDIIAFHQKFHLIHEGQVRRLPKKMQNFRVKFLREELKEYEEAVANGDLELMFDSLVDIVYVALGTAYLHGFPFEQGWKEVHKANMLKVRAKTVGESSRHSTHDVVKPEDWIPPNLKQFIG